MDTISSVCVCACVRVCACMRVTVCHCAYVCTHMHVCVHVLLVLYDGVCYLSSLQVMSSSANTCIKYFIGHIHGHHLISPITQACESKSSLTRRSVHVCVCMYSICVYVCMCMCVCVYVHMCMLCVYVPVSIVCLIS